MITTKRSSLAFFFTGILVLIIVILSIFTCSALRFDPPNYYIFIADAVVLACFPFLINQATGMLRRYEFDSKGIIELSIFMKKRRVSWDDYPYSYIVTLITIYRDHPRRTFILLSKKPIPVEIKKSRDASQLYYMTHSKEYIIFEHSDELVQKIQAIRPNICFIKRNLLS